LNLDCTKAGKAVQFPLLPLPLGIQRKCVISGHSLHLNVSFPSESTVPKHPWLCLTQDDAGQLFLISYSHWQGSSTL